MSVLANTPGCVGINIPASTSYPTRVLAGHNMVDLPGGLTVVGSHLYEDAPPRWVDLNRYSITETATSRGQYLETMGEVNSAKDPMSHPVTMVSTRYAIAYLSRRGNKLFWLPTEEQWENAARGPALNMRELMEKETGKFTSGDFVEFAEGRFENFVFALRGQVFVNPKENEQFRRMMEQGMPFFGWRVYGTPSGRLTPEEAWYCQKEKAPVDWGPKNAYGVKGMAGGVAEWAGWYRNYLNFDRSRPGEVTSRGVTYNIVRGASWYTDSPLHLCAAHRAIHPGESDYGIGFRVVANDGPAFNSL